MLHISHSKSKHLLHIPNALLSRHTVSYSQIKSNDIFDQFDHLLRNCSKAKQSKQIHAQIIHFGGLSTVFLPSRLISTYSNFNLLTDAKNVFNTLPNERIYDTIIWNSMLRANVTNNECKETVNLYTRMQKVGVFVDEFSFPLVIKACAMMGNVKLCALVHCHSILSGFKDNMYVANELLVAYGKVGRMGVARQVFDEMLVRNLVSWNTMVSGFSSNCDCEGAFEMFRRMERDGWEPNIVTWTSLLSSYSRCGRRWETLRLYNVMRNKFVSVTAESISVVVSVCKDSDVLNKGREIHGYVVTAGFEDYSFTKNALLCMYGKCAEFQSVEKLFAEIKIKNVVSWNALISLYVQVGLCDEAFTTFLKLEKSEKHLAPNVISWSAIINGFAANGRSAESLDLFRKMQRAKVRPNVVTVTSLLLACADLSTVVIGKETHGYIVRNAMDDYLLVGNRLIDMYAKCGSLKDAHIVFKNIKNKDVCSWNTIIGGYGMLGNVDIALNIFKQMIDNGCNPDGVTFVSLLSACSHTGLVDEGRKLFNEMKRKFGIEPEIEHYACMVDLFGRAGLFQEASEVAKNMPGEPNVCVWGALLNSSRMHRNVDWDQELVSKILDASPATGNYMLMSNIYAESGQWEDSAKVRVSARARGLTKTPGQSWIEVNKKVHMFTAGEFVEGEMKEVHKLLKILSFELKPAIT